MRQHTQTRTRRIIGTVLATSLAVSLAACTTSDDKPTTEKPGATAPASAIDKDAIIEAGISYGLSGGFDPMITTGAVTVAANWHVLEGLTELDPATREVYAALGADLPTKIDDNTYEVTLRDGAVFHDGTAVTTDDVVFSFTRVMDPANNSLYAGFIQFIESVEAKDDKTVTIKTKYPFSLVNERISTVKIVPKAYVESNYEAFNALPVGTGPYKMTKATPEDEIVFERFDDYTGDRPALAAGLEWNLLGDPAARVTAMTTGTISAMEDVPYIDVPSMESAATVESVQSFGTLFMMFNTDLAPYDNVDVRQAFFYALDMEKIVETGMLGQATAATSFLPETHPNYHEASTVYSYDPEKAKQLLADAGVAEGTKVTVLMTDTGWVQDVAPIIKESLDAVGLDVTLDIGQSGGQYTKVDNGELQVMVAPGDPSVFGNDPDLLMRWWFGDNVWSQKRYNWNDTPEFKEVLSTMDAAVEATGDEQQKLWNTTFDLLSDNAVLYPLLHRKLPTAWNSDELSGFAPLPITGLSFLDVGKVAE